MTTTIPLPITNEIALNVAPPAQGFGYYSTAVTTAAGYAGNMVVFQRATTPQKFTTLFEKDGNGLPHVTFTEPPTIPAGVQNPRIRCQFQTSETALSIQRMPADNSGWLDVVNFSNAISTLALKPMVEMPLVGLEAYTDFDEFVQFFFLPAAVNPDGTTPPLAFERLCFVRIMSYPMVLSFHSPFASETARKAYIPPVGVAWTDNLSILAVSNRLYFACGILSGDYASVPLTRLLTEWNGTSPAINKTVRAKLSNKQYVLDGTVLSDVTPAAVTSEVVGNKAVPLAISASSHQAPSEIRKLPSAVSAVAAANSIALSTTMTAFTMQRAALAGHGDAFSAMYWSDLITRVGRLTVWPVQASDSYTQAMDLTLYPGGGNMNIASGLLNTSTWATADPAEPYSVPLMTYNKITAADNIYKPLIGFRSPMGTGQLSHVQIEMYFTPDVDLIDYTQTRVSVSKLIFLRIVPYNVIVCVNSTTLSPAGGNGGMWWRNTREFVKDTIMLPIGKDAADRATIPWPFLWTGGVLPLSKFDIGNEDYTYDGLTMYKSKTVLFQTEQTLDKYDRTTGLPAPPPFSLSTAYSGTSRNMNTYFSERTSAVSLPTSTDSTYKTGALAIKSLPNKEVTGFDPINTAFQYAASSTGKMQARLYDPRLEFRDEVAGYNCVLDVSVGVGQTITFKNMSIVASTGVVPYTFSPSADTTQFNMTNIMEQLAPIDTYAPLIGRTNTRLPEAGNFPIEFYFYPNQANALITPTFNELSFVRFPTINVIYCFKPCPSTVRTKNQNADHWWTKPHLFEPQMLYVPAGTQPSGFVGIPMPTAWTPVPTTAPKVDVTIGTPPVSYQYDAQKIVTTPDALGDSIPDTPSSGSSEMLLIVGGIGLLVLLIFLGIHLFGGKGHSEDYDASKSRERRRRRRNSEDKHSREKKKHSKERDSNRERDPDDGPD